MNMYVCKRTHRDGEIVPEVGPHGPAADPAGAAPPPNGRVPVQVEPAGVEHCKNPPLAEAQQQEESQAALGWERRDRDGEGTRVSTARMAIKNRQAGRQGDRSFQYPFNQYYTASETMTYVTLVSPCRPKTHDIREWMSVKLAYYCTSVYPVTGWRLDHGVACLVPCAYWDKLQVQ